jgi:PAT family beta-lactamase induction signal transducer AmpG
VSTKAIGNIIAMVSWPWIMKWVWGPFIDRFGYAPMGRRRPWILAAQVLLAITLLTMPQISNLAANLRFLGLMVLVVNIFASLQDVSVDALAVDLLPEKERGLACLLVYVRGNVRSLDEARHDHDAISRRDCFGWLSPSIDVCHVYGS